MKLKLSKTRFFKEIIISKNLIFTIGVVNSVGIGNNEYELITKESTEYDNIYNFFNN